MIIGLLLYCKEMELHVLERNIRSILSNDDCSTLETRYQKNINIQDKVKFFFAVLA